MRSVRIGGAAALLALATGCYELEQDVDIHEDGTIGYRWALTLHPGMAKILKAPPVDEFERQVAGHLGTYGRPIVREDPGRTTYGVEVTVPDVAAYATFRESFISVYEGKWGTAPWLYPPEIVDMGSTWLVKIEAPPTQQGTVAEPKEGELQTRWTLDVRVPGEPSANDADRIAADGTLTWETDIAHARLDGVRAAVTFPDPTGSGIGWVLGGAALIGVIGAGAAMGVRARRASR